MSMWLLMVLLGAQATAPDRVLGLLSLPQVFGTTMCDRFEPQDVVLHSLPSDGTAVASIRVDRNWSFAAHGGCEGLAVSVHRGTAREALPTLEYDYEMPAVVVLEQRSGWFRIRLQQGSAWIQASTLDRFMPLADLFEEFVGVTRIEKQFAGSLLREPGAGATAAPVKPGQSVQVLEFRDVAGRSFVKVEVMSHSLCSAGDLGPPEVVATGWLPLHAQSGDPSIWFSSRGC